VELVKGVPKPPASINEVKILDGVIEAIQNFKKYGTLTVLLVTCSTLSFQ
jgi:hypothetical protein